MFAARINLGSTEGRLEPSKKVLEAALKDLVEDVGCDGSENIEEREVLPERMINGFDMCFSTCLCEFRWIVIGKGKSIEDCLPVTWSALGFIVAKLCMWYQAFGALPVLAARHKELFRIIGGV
jgi:hypothetical protein